jgi:glutamate N-acetyltransferase / amino-acid N-acetyltransferase
MKKLEGGLENVPGYRFSAVEAGIRYENRLDYTLIAADDFCNAAGMFTRNRIISPAVRLSRQRIENPIKAILVNSTNANTCTGDEGYSNALSLTADIAANLSVPEESVIMSSTGIIGHQLPREKMMSFHEKLVSELSREKGSQVPRAIMTTDTYPKSCSVSFDTAMGEYVIAGTAKGSGMIAPDMATMLSYAITDAPVKRDSLVKIFRSVTEETLNSVTIDGDMSTNDTAILLSPAGNSFLEKKSDLESFNEALYSVMYSLSEMLVDDAEGGTKVVRIDIKNAANSEDAKRAARSIAESVLVKTAFFGNDPNWGRIAMAAGYSGAEIDEKKLSIYFDDLPLYLTGKPVDFENNDINKVMKQNRFTVTVDFGLGSSHAHMLTSDLTYEYVKINAEYTT